MKYKAEIEFSQIIKHTSFYVALENCKTYYTVYS